MDKNQTAAEKLLSLKSFLLYKEIQLVKNGELAKVLDILKKRVKIITYSIIFIAIASVSIWLSVPLGFDHSFSIYDYALLMINLAMVLMVIVQIKKINSIIDESERTIAGKSGSTLNIDSGNLQHH